MGRHSAFACWLISLALICTGVYLMGGLPIMLIIAGIIGWIMTAVLYDPAKGSGSWKSRVANGIAGRRPKVGR